jgi:hypothetical protein
MNPRVDPGPQCANTRQLGLFFQPPEQCWGLTEIGFVWLCFSPLRTAKTHQNSHKPLPLLT